MKRKLFLIWTLIALTILLGRTGGRAFLVSSVQAQSSFTAIQGHVFDAVSGEPLPFVQVGFYSSNIGTSTDMDGRFYISNSNGLDSVRFQLLGYEPHNLVIKKGRITRNAKILLQPKTNVMHTVTVTADKKSRSRYRRKDNPAVEIIKKTIEHKNRNRESSLDKFDREIYEKTNLALDDFHPDFEKKRIWRKLRFLEKYIDVTPFDDTPILTISMREVIKKQSWQRIQNQLRTLITAARQEGLDQMLDQEGIDESLGEMFVPIDIYDNNIELMLNHFTGPLNSSIATVFYHYYITDTVMVDSIQCVEISFTPANQRNYGFTGQLYVTLDGTYSIARFSMKVASQVNLNFVRDLTIMQSFKQHDSIFLPKRQDAYGRIFIHKKLQEVYAHQVRIFQNYNIADSATILPDSLFSPLSNTARLQKTFMRRKVWNEIRPIQLTAKETVIDSLRYELARLPEMQRIKKTAEILATGYIPTRYPKDSSRFDLGPIYNFISYNHQEGWRLRIGGMTKAPLSNRNFIEGYLAYGFRDRRPKGNVTYIHTFDTMRHHAHETPLGHISLSASYDLVTPGQSIDIIERDNILASDDIVRKVQYVAQAVGRLRKEWDNHVNIDTWIAARHITPVGALNYQQYNADGTLSNVKSIAEAEWMGKIAFSPYNADDNSRPNDASSIHLRRNAPVFNLSHRIGLMSGNFFYQRTDFNAEKKFQLGILGYLDTRAELASVWNRVPYPHLCFPDANDNIFLSSRAFNTMKPMEFVMDRYAALFLDYHLKGLILNNIPLINRLRLREVASFNILYGTLSNKNNPNAADNQGLYKLPEGTSAIGSSPYMEFSVGVENILKLIRIDFVRRLSYCDGMTSRQRNSIRIAFRFTL